MVELTLYTPEMTWETLSFFPGSAEVKILRTEQGGARTLLVRLPSEERSRRTAISAWCSTTSWKVNTKPRERCSAPVLIDCCPSTPTSGPFPRKKERLF